MKDLQSDVTLNLKTMLSISKQSSKHSFAGTFLRLTIGFRQLGPSARDQQASFNSIATISEAPWLSC